MSRRTIEEIREESADRGKTFPMEPAKHKPPLDPNPDVRTIPLVEIATSRTNPRKTFDKGKLEELIESVKRVGVLQPILVRPITPDSTRFGTREEKFELVAGERRLRAARIAGLSGVPCIVRTLTDVEVLELQLVENLQRVDLHPMEEAEGYEQLHKKHGYSVDDLALKVGKSKAYVYARLKLCALPPAARKAFFEGDLNPSTALLVARIPDRKLQEQATKEITKGRFPLSYREAADHVQRRYMLRLSEAPFAAADADLVPKAGPCTTCPKRTGNQPELFGDVKSADVCTDPKCFEEKRDAAWERQTQDAREKGQEVLSASASAKLWPKNWYSSSPRGDEYVLLEQTCTRDPQYRTYGALIGRYVTPILARDSEGKIRKLMRKKDLPAAFKAAGVSFKKERSPAKSARSSGNDLFEIRRRANDLLVAAVGEKVRAEKKVDKAFWLFLARNLTKLIYDDDGASLKRHCIEGDAYDSKTEKKLLEQLLKYDEAQLRSFVVEMSLIQGDPETLKRAATRYRLDLKKLERQVRDEIKAAKKDKKGKNGKSAKAKPGTCSECGCTEDNACETESGEPCSWVNSMKTLCSGCAEQE